MEKSNFETLYFSAEQVAQKREQIRKKLLIWSLNIFNGKIEKIAVQDLKYLFQFYDEVFFEGYFKKNLKEKVKFSMSSKMSRAAGKTIYSKRRFHYRIEEEFEIRMGVQFLFKYYEVNREKVVSGIQTKDAVEAFQIVWEHELCHLIEFHLYQESDCKKERFKKIAYAIFGHKDVYHQLPTNQEVAYEKYGVKIGDMIQFICQGNLEEGIIYGIHKRVTVMKLDQNGAYTDKIGNRYSKWYVPIEAIVKKRQR